MAHGAETLSAERIRQLKPAEVDATYGTYQPTRRVLGSMARAAAAGEFLKDTELLVGTGDRPDEPRRIDDAELEMWLEGESVKIAA